MKTLLKKIFTLILVVTVSVSACICGVGCGDSSSGDLQIAVTKYGYGTAWLNALADAFEAKTGKTVDVTEKVGNSGQTSFDSELESYASKTDIFFTKRGWFAEDVYKGKITVKGQSYACLYEDLTDVWNSVAAEGETKTIKEKMDPTYADALNIEGKYYNLPWAGGVLGIVRNVKVWNALGLTDADMPYTTDELVALCKKVKNAGKAPFIYSSGEEYYTAWAPVFFAQYEGKDNAQQFLNGIDPDGNVTQYVYTYEGHSKALEVIETLIDPGNGYQHKDATSLDFNTMQGFFLEGEALFCINGAWLENEMAANYQNSVIDMIKTPVISSIVDKLSFKSNNSANDDAKLKEVIQYVDAVDAGESPAKPEGVTDADIKVVTEARHYSFRASGVDHRAYIPSYSDQIPLAKEFLKFMYSDEGLNIYYQTLKGTMLPATPTTGEYDSTGLTLTTFRISTNKAQQDGFIYDCEPKARYFVLNSISTWYQLGGIDAINELEKVNGLSAKEVMDAIDTYIDGKWTKFSTTLGLN